jgi:hypothetical protein
MVCFSLLSAPYVFCKRDGKEKARGEEGIRDFFVGPALVP